MRSCKKCRYFGRDFFCKSFKIKITSTLNATKCTRYIKDEKKEKELNSNNTRKRKLQKKDSKKKKAARICLECTYNIEGYCNKYKRWCNNVNNICLSNK